MKNHRSRRPIAIVTVAVSAMLAAMLSSVSPASSQEGDVTDPVAGPGPVDPGLGDEQIDALEAAAAAEIGPDVVTDGAPIVPQGTNAALDAADGAADDDDTAGMTPDPAPDLLADASAESAAPVINRPEPGTAASISFAEAPAAADLLAADAALPDYIQEELDTAKRSQVVTVSTPDLAADLAAESVTIDLFDVTLELRTNIAPSPGALNSVMWGATPADGAPGNPFGVVTIIEDRMIGGFWMDGARYEMRPLGNGNHLLFEVGRELEADAEPEDGPAGPDNGPSPYGPGGEFHAGVGTEDDLLADAIAAPVVDVMVAVDAEAEAAYGSEQAAIDDAVANVNLTNVTYLNSGTTSVQNMNLTNVYFTNYTPTTTNGYTYRDQLANKTDGTFDALHAVRDANGADLVVLIFNRNMFTSSGGGLCGVAFFPTSANPAENDAYNITKRSCATPTALTFPHELGHNQCAGHDVTGGGCSVYTTDMGYFDSSTNQRTIMARNSNGGTRLPVWSDPNGSFNGWTTGTASTDNYFVLEQEDRAPGTVSGGVADYRSSFPSERAMAGLDGVTCIFNSLEDAITNAAPGSTIYVAPGTYAAQSSGVNYNVSKDLDIVQGTNLCKPTASPVVNGVILQPNASTASDAVLEISGSALVTLDHITVEGSTSTADGGNVQIFSGAELVLDDSIVRNANVPLDGAGVRVLSNATLTMVGNSQIEGNVTTGNGGGVYVDGGTVNMNGLGDVDGNSAAQGGGIYAVAGSVVNVTSNGDVLDNTATSNGGGIYVDNSIVTVTDPGSFVGSSTSGNGAGSGGGGIFATNGATVVIESGGTVGYNTAGFAGGVRTVGGATVVVNDGGTVVGNDATNIGGGGFYSSSPSTIDLNAGAAVFANTSTTQGGAGRVFGTLDIQGTGSVPVVISNNSATTDGGGFWFGSGAHELDTFVFSGNSAQNGGALAVANGSVDIREDLSCGPATLSFEEYCNEFRNNSATSAAGAVHVAGGTVTGVQTGFVGNNGPNGDIVVVTGTGTFEMRSSMFVENVAGGSGNGVVTWNGSANTVRLIGVTFAANAERALDFDGTGTHTVELSRVLTDNGDYNLGSPTGSCNLSQVGSSLPNRILGDPRFEPTDRTAYSPAPLGPAADRCDLLGGHSQDVFDSGAVDADGDASSTEWDIGGVETPKQPIIRPGGIGGPEGDSGVKVVDVPVYLDEPHTAPITVDYATISSTATGRATESVDYIAATGTVTFDPGETQESVPITIIGDTVFEPNLFLGEWLPIAYSNPSLNAELDVQTFFGLGLVIIGNDD